MTGIWRLRAAALAVLGVLAVHYGRYAVAPPQHEHQLSTAHGYLTWLGPLSIVLALITLAHLLVVVARTRTGAPPALPSGRILWFVMTVTLLSAFGAQESVETFLTHGRLPELGELLAAGGWAAIPLAAAAAAAIALLLRGAASVVRWALERRRAKARRLLVRPTVPSLPTLAAPRSVLARRLAGRGPPVLS
ncbi:MAG TPA: hypothetical protein VD790_02165 [Thermoleophilaceae bacterium]|nr:hypothetical protein [Thermoleophilaceae bacterium]